MVNDNQIIRSRCLTDPSSFTSVRSARCSAEDEDGLCPTVP